MTLSAPGAGTGNAPAPAGAHANRRRDSRHERLFADLSVPCPPWLTRALLAIFFTVLAIVLVDFSLSWNQPLLEDHSFRQTQTALTAYWLGRGGPLLAYETPVLGYPWSIPFEFPLFQMIAATLARLSGLPLDQAGRLVSFLFYLATVWMLFELGRALGLGTEYMLIAASLYLFSPLHRFWGRSFLIESCALFLGFLYLALIARGMRSRHRPHVWGAFAAAAGVGALAGMVKVTTFAVFLLAAAMLFAAALCRSREVARATWRATIGALPWQLWLVAVIVPITVVEGWTAFADSHKALNPLGEALMSGRLTAWNFGGLSQRFDAALWRDVIWTRAISEAIGGWSAFLLLLAAAVWLRGRALFLTLCLLALFLSAFLVFTNLHVVHNYYQYANAVFLVLAAGTCIWMAGRRRPSVLLGLLISVLVLQHLEFARGYRPKMFATFDIDSNRTLDVARVLRAQTEPEDVVLVYGYDWSSEVAYYSRRRTVTVPDWWAPIEVLEHPGRHLGAQRLGAIVVCPGALVDDRFELALKRLASYMQRDPTTECRIFVEPATQP